MGTTEAKLGLGIAAAPIDSILQEEYMERPPVLLLQFRFK